jgi:PilZ domain
MLLATGYKLFAGLVLNGELAVWQILHPRYLPTFPHAERVKLRVECRRMTLDTERRKESRKRPPSLVYVELASANGGMMRDICEEGFAMRAMMPLRIGDSTPFAFSLDASTRFEGSCQVLWVEEEGHVAGLKFTSVSPQLLQQVRVWLAEEETEPEQSSIAPTREVNTLDELRAELRGVKPRTEIPPPKVPAVEKVPREILQAETPRVESPIVERPRVEPARIEPPRVEPPPLIEPPQVELPRVDLRRMEIPRVQEPTPMPRAEEKIREMPTVEEMIAPPASRGLGETTSRSLEEEEYESVQPEAPTFAERFSSQFEEAIQDPPAFQPLPELREPGLLEARAPRVDSSTVSLAIRILIFLALIAAGVVFHRDLGNGLIWLGSKLSGAGPQTAWVPESPANAVPAQQTPPPTQPPVSSPDTPQNSLPTTELKQTNPAPSSTETKKQVNPPAVAIANPASVVAKPKNPASSVPATNKAQAQKTGNEPEFEAGEQEYSQAQEILKSGDSEGGFQQAVRLLWIAVEKGNAKAEVSLAELYRTGEGVTKNCDQTRILLTAAARKGNAEAQRRLDAFLREGCE